LKWFVVGYSYISIKGNQHEHTALKTMPETTTTAATDAEDTAPQPQVLVLDHPDTEAAIPNIRAILEKAPKCLACFAPGNADAFNEDLFADFPRTLDAARWSFGMAQALRIDPLPERVAEFKKLLEIEVVGHLTQLQDLVNAPKSALGVRMDPLVAQGAAACVAHLKQAVVAGQTQLDAHDARVAALLDELAEERRQQHAAQIDLIKAQRALVNAGALEAATTAALKHARGVVELFDAAEADEPSASKRARC
jgi:hypothetical protein